MATGQPCSSPNAIDLVGGGEELGGAGHARHARCLGGDAARHLVAHHLDGLGRRADEGHAPLGDGAGEVGVLGEEAVAGVHGVGAGLLDDVEDALGVEVALGRGLPAERVGLVGQPDVERFAVELGVHRHAGDAELLARTDDADGDLAPVGDQDLGQHAIWLPACRVDVPDQSWRAARAAGSPTCAGSPRPVRPTPTRSRSAATARRRGSSWSPTTRRRVAGGAAARGRRRRAPSLLVSIAAAPAGGRGRGLHDGRGRRRGRAP